MKISPENQMNTQLFDSIFQAVSDGTQRQWTEQELALIKSDIDLMNQLECWAESNNSDGCWHPLNYQLIKPNSITNTNNSCTDEEIHIPF
jgi:hypothetical protein